MSNTPSNVLTTEQQAHLNISAAQALGLRHIDVETISARKVTYTDVERLAATQGGFRFDGYIADEVGFLIPAEFEVRAKRRPSEGSVHQAVYAAVEKPKRSGTEMVADPDNIVGYKVEAEGKSVFGNVYVLTLYTSAEAEGSDRVLQGNRRAGEDNDRLYLADDDGDPQPLMPIFGSQATVSFIAEGIDADLLAERLRRVLAEEFGEALRSNMKVLTRPVENRRVDVYTTDGEAAAINILPAEVSLAMEKRGAVTVKPHALTGGLMIGS